MRILHIVHQYMPDAVGGTELYTHWLSQALQAQGHQNFIFFRRSGAGVGLESWAEAGVQVYAGRAGVVTPQSRVLATFGDGAMRHQFEQVLKTCKPDVIHIQHLMGLPAQVIDLIQSQNLPYIITYHDFWWVCANAQLLSNYDKRLCAGPHWYINCAHCALARMGRGNLWPFSPLITGPFWRRNQLLNRIMQGARRIISPSEFVRQWYLGQGLPPQKIITLPHGLPLPDVLPPKDNARNNKLRLAYIGGLSWQKGVHIVVEAFQAVAETAELWVAGDETADPAYTAQLRQLAGDGVTFLGRLSREDVWQTLAQVDAVVVPALWYETFSFIISEAFALGIPVIASNIGPLAERVQAEVDGLLVAPGDIVAWQQTLKRLIAEPDLLKQLGKNIKPGLSIAAYAHQVEGIYSEVLGT